ncbi:biliverdin-producing heme oxygenase [Stakelama tenebrarum]|uniref:Biliverdin-producing heme oxygenase n=1 Tax=Stakelama tenebrarum TaxID=2711215 RepID=A0A6G6Y2K1_9SPHN|nr:biliverdin-producing heme oxygenase [Sphingosinithalassobacter tenebrarum]QIG79071.1 biliverdin-producing heme oxygenase [Sphingosinithalassobacter tenebrarum]
MTEIRDLVLSKRLKAQTHATHDRLDGSIMATGAFETRESYGWFVQVQWALHREVDALYDAQRLCELLPGLEARRRLTAIEADLADLGLTPPPVDASPVFDTDAPIDIPTALGWLYVVEGSNLGAALLRKKAAELGLSDSYGGRHLAPAAEGPAAHWRAFTEALDAIPLHPEDEARAAAGANAAFAHVQSLVDRRLD